MQHIIVDWNFIWPGEFSAGYSAVSVSTPVRVGCGVYNLCMHEEDQELDEEEPRTNEQEKAELERSQRYGNRMKR